MKIEKEMQKRKKHPTQVQYFFWDHFAEALGKTPKPRWRLSRDRRQDLCSGPKKNSLNIKFLGGIFLGHPGPRRRDVPDKNFMQVAFFCCFRQGVAGMSRDLGRDVPDLEKLYARKLWADFSYPICDRKLERGQTVKN